MVRSADGDITLAQNASTEGFCATCPLRNTPWRWN